MPFSPFPELTTDRLRLRRTLASDAEAIFFLRSDPAVNALVKRSAPKTLADASEFIRLRQLDITNEKMLYWSISLKDDPTMIGSICLWNFSKDKQLAEVGYDLHTDFHQQGIMNEAMEVVVAYGFGPQGLDIIEAYTQNDNIGSKKLLLKNGFAQDEKRKDDHNPKNVIFVARRAMPNP
ncbi:MAG: GNAT family N-acetyltransferase [Bacteroidia bacterium]